MKTLYTVFWRTMWIMVCFISCEKTEHVDVPGEPEPEVPSATHYYYSYVAQKVIGAPQLGLTTGEFVPGCTYVYGDTLFIANVQSGHFSVELYSLGKQERIGSLKQWTYNGTQQSFGNYVEAISVSGGRLYLANIGSCVDVFDVKTLEFITRIGNRNWGSGSTQLFHAHAMAVVGDYIVIRMKNRLQVHLQSDLKAGSYQNIPFYARGITDGFDVNNGWYSHQMAVDSTGLIYLADYGQYGNKKIQVIDTALIRKGDNQVMTDDRTIKLDFNPQGIALYENQMYVSAADGSIRFYDRIKKEFYKTCKSVKGYTFKGVTKLFMQGNRLWVTDKNTKEVIGVDIFRNEIDEYQPGEE